MQTSNSRWTTKMLTEGAIAIALSFVLGLFTIFEFPQGGSITAGQMIPIIIFSLRYGAGKGFLVGAVYGVINMIFGGYVMHPVQAILDYPLAFGSLGLAGLFADDFNLRHDYSAVFKGTFIAVIARLICHVLTGVIFFASYAPENQSALVYSIIYNGTFLLFEFVITMLILSLLQKFIQRDLARI